MAVCSTKGGVLLRHALNMRDGSIGLLNANRLFGCCQADLVYQLTDARNGIDHFSDRLQGRAHLLRALGDLVDRSANQRPNLLRSAGTALSQGAHLGGHHSKAAPLFLSARAASTAALSASKLV